MFKAVIYDLDGTLVDTTRMNTATLQRIVKEELHKDIPYDELKEYIGYSGKKTLELLGIPKIEEVYPRWVSYVQTSGILAEPYPGVPETLEYINQSGIIQAVMSSKMKNQYELDITNNHMGQYFKLKTLAEDTKLHKPQIEPMIHILHQLQMKPDEVLYVGDTENDWKCCKDSGVAFAYASWGPLEMNQAADYYLRKLQDLYSILGI